MSLQIRNVTHTRYTVASWFLSSCGRDIYGGNRAETDNFSSAREHSHCCLPLFALFDIHSTWCGTLTLIQLLHHRPPRTLTQPETPSNHHLYPNGWSLCLLCDGYYHHRYGTRPCPCGSSTLCEQIKRAIARSFWDNAPPQRSSRPYYYLCNNAPTCPDFHDPSHARSEHRCFTAPAETGEGQAR